jgi:hypothetical protein
MSILDRRVLLEAHLGYHVWGAYYNVSPFEARGHFLWIPTDGAPRSLRHCPQRLTRAFLADLLRLGTELPEMIVFFNAIGAGASADHIHIQAVARAGRYQLDNATTKDHQGFAILDGLPFEAIVWSLDDSHETLAAMIEDLQEHEEPFNLIVMNGRVFLILRSKTDPRFPALPGTTFASMEFAGKLIVTDRQTYDSLNEGVIHRAWRERTRSAREFIATGSEIFAEEGCWHKSTVEVGGEWRLRRSVPVGISVCLLQEQAQ